MASIPWALFWGPSGCGMAPFGDPISGDPECPHPSRGSRKGVISGSETQIWTSRPQIHGFRNIGYYLILGSWPYSGNPLFTCHPFWAGNPPYIISLLGPFQPSFGPEPYGIPNGRDPVAVSPLAYHGSKDHSLYYVLNVSISGPGPCLHPYPHTSWGHSTRLVSVSVFWHIRIYGPVVVYYYILINH